MLHQATLSILVLSCTISIAYHHSPYRYTLCSQQTIPPSSSSSALRAASSAGMMNEDNWYSMSDCLVLLPKDEIIPRSIIHFIGGFIAGSAPAIGYNSMLQDLSLRGHLVVASPLPPLSLLNHLECAETIQKSFYRCYNENLLPMLGKDNTATIPVIGLSHSLGGKLRILAECNPNRIKQIDTCANIYLAFNNFDASQSLDMAKKQLESVSPEARKVMDAMQSPEVKRAVDTARSPMSGLKDVLLSNIPKDTRDSVASMFSSAVNERVNSILNDVDSRVNKLLSEAQFEFTPTAAETWRMLEAEYDNPSNIVIKFADDDIDQSQELVFHLTRRGFTPLLLTCRGSHVTPNAPASDTAAAELYKLLRTQVNSIADANWGRRMAPRNRMPTSTSRYYLPSQDKTSAAAEWDDDNY